MTLNFLVFLFCKIGSEFSSGPPLDDKGEADNDGTGTGADSGVIDPCASDLSTLYLSFIIGNHYMHEKVHGKMN